MLRGLIIGLALCGATLSIYFGGIQATVGMTILAALHALATKTDINKAYFALQRELNRLTIYLARAMVILAVIVGLATAMTDLGREDAIVAGLFIGLALVPGSVMLVMHFVAPRRRGALGLHNLVKIIRGSLVVSATKLVVVLLGLVLLTQFHIQPAITLPQLLVIDLLALGLPLAALAWDKSPHKLKRDTASVLRRRLTSPHAFGSFLGFGLVMAGLAWANHLLLFARHDLSPAYIDPSLPLYQEATALALLTIALCLYVHLLFERAETHQKFFTPYLTSNKKLLQAMSASLFLVIGVVYHPWLQAYFGTGPLGIVDWLSAVFCAGLYLSLRLLQRHTRKHTRHAVLRLHHEVHGR